MSLLPALVADAWACEICICMLRALPSVATLLWTLMGTAGKCLLPQVILRLCQPAQQEAALRCDACRAEVSSCRSQAPEQQLPGPQI